MNEMRGNEVHSQRLSTSLMVDASCERDQPESGRDGTGRDHSSTPSTPQPLDSCKVGFTYHTVIRTLLDSLDSLHSAGLGLPGCQACGMAYTYIHIRHSAPPDPPVPPPAATSPRPPWHEIYIKSLWATGNWQLAHCLHRTASGPLITTEQNTLHYTTAQIQHKYSTIHYCYRL